VNGISARLARDLRTGCGFNVEACPESRRAGIERGAEGGGGKAVQGPRSQASSLPPMRMGVCKAREAIIQANDGIQGKTSGPL